MSTEIWKDIPNYEGYYQVSSYGRFISKKNHIIKQHLNKDGDLIITLSRDSKKKTYIAHKIVAQTFIPNPENLRYIIHIDGNKQNNHIDNLRWAASYCLNVIYQFDKQGNFIAKYNSFVEAHRKTDANQCGILQCVQGKIYTTHGYIFIAEQDLNTLPDRMAKINKRYFNLRGIAVNQYTMDGTFIKTYPSMAEVERQNYFCSNVIGGCCNGTYKQAYGYIWRYAD